MDPLAEIARAVAYYRREGFAVTRDYIISLAKPLGMSFQDCLNRF